MKDKAASDSFDRPLAPGTARVAGRGAPLERLGVRFLRCEAGWIDFAMDALAPEWRTRCTHLNDPFVDMLRWLGEIVGGERSARWEVAEEGGATQFVYMPPSRNSLGESCGVLVQTGSNESALFYSWACAIDPERLVSEIYAAFRGFVESSAYRPDEWAWNGVNEDDLPDLFELDADEFKLFEGKFPIWSGRSLRALRSARIEAYVAGQHLTPPPSPPLSREAVCGLVAARAQLAAIERGVLPVSFFRGPAPWDMPRFDVQGVPAGDGAYGPVWRRMWQAFEGAGVVAPAKDASLKSAAREPRLDDHEHCASLSWAEAGALLAAKRRRALSGEVDAPPLAEARLFGAITQRLLFLSL